MAAVAAAGGALRAGTRVASAASTYYPHFSWNTVPVVADIGKRSGDFSPSEIEFLANRFAYLSIEKGQATDVQPAGSKRTEVGVRSADQALKAANPNVKVLFYWSMRTFHPDYASAANFDPSWAKQSGNQLNFDLENPALHRWWIESAASVVDDPGIDGAYIDSLNNRVYDPGEHAMLQGLRERVRASGKEPIIICNARFPLPPGDPASFFDVIDGTMYEHFDSYGNTSPEKVRDDLLAIQSIAKSGKIVHFKAWPGFTLSDPSTRTTPYADLVAMARQNITFPLACFLAIAEKNSYLQYSWGYNNLEGTYILQDDKTTVDPAWYPELLKPLGPPQGDAAIDGYVFRRSFEHADVHLDIAAHSANINWH